MTATILTTLARLEAIAFAEAVRTHERCDIEYDRMESAAYLRIGKVLYVAACPAIGGAS
jgi:hypothetical protein